VEAILPGRAIFGKVEKVSNPADCLRLGRKIFRNAGFAGFMGGFNPYTCSDEILAGALKTEILLRIRPEGIGTGPADPGGWGWMLTWAVGVACIVAALMVLV
jgi:hypothetical protein